MGDQGGGLSKLSMVECGQVYYRLRDCLYPMLVGASDLGGDEDDSYVPLLSLVYL